VRNGAAVAQKVQTLVIDDLDGRAAAGTVRFGLDGTECEIDLPGMPGSCGTRWRPTCGLGGGSAVAPAGLPAAGAGGRRAG
jgi:Lsr2